MKKLFLQNFAILSNSWNTEYGSIWKHVTVLTGCDGNRCFDGTSTTFMQILSCETVTLKRFYSKIQYEFKQTSSMIK